MSSERRAKRAKVGNDTEDIDAGDDTARVCVTPLETRNNTSAIAGETKGGQIEVGSSEYGEVPELLFGRKLGSWSSAELKEVLQYFQALPLPVSPYSDQIMLWQANLYQ